MKRILVVLVFIMTICEAHPQISGLLINENFTGYSNGDLNTTAGGQGSWKASFSNNSCDFVQVAVSAPLMYPEYTSGTQYINVKQKNDHRQGMYPDDPSKAFTNGIVPVHTDNTTFYLSFLVRVPSAAGVATIGDARPNTAIRTMNGGVFGNFYIGTEAGQLKFGINKNSKAGGKFAAGVYKFNTTYLIVMRYDVANGEASADYDDKMYLWVNPSLSAEPFISSADVSIDKNQNFEFDGDVDAPAQSLQLFQEPYSATASFDAFKLAYAQGFNTDTSNAAAAWSVLSPAGTPLPVRFSDFKGFIRHGQVELEWHVDFEFNVLRYEIERSNDGVHFFYAGAMAARNSESGSSYKWIDVFPGAGNNYYRIKNVYKDGNLIYSSVVKLTVKDQLLLFTVYPNPVLQGNMFLRATDLQPGNYVIEIMNTEKQVLFRKQINHTGGNINQALTLPTAVKSGIYSIQLTGNEFIEAKTFIIP